ncbi:PSD1 and planctomycete cytochrome C domain-containing protein [Anatilimnocola floriformis]|uniref:PSD1 and planctomycete cytochrome C domain-containing protein n=1 Tax=Anatilimnocola floriformis TaxID=2948575 RepID=UPI0020C37EA0|nr:PSD1 and planctomycete cytochrome C domain-containing protein [Anatilimnocola floriformis]
MPRISLLILLAVSLLAFAQCVRAADGDSEAGLQLFRAEIEPALKTHCYRCHSAQATPLEGSLRLDHREGVRRGGDSGPAVVLGKPADSLLVQALRHEGLEMPPKQPKLPDATIAHFVRWIELGAPDPRDAPAEIAETWPAAARQHWAFQPIRLPAVPTVRQAGENAVDAFVRERLEQKDWESAPAASRRELIRRLSFDLTGLPPAPTEIERFENDRAPDAYEQLVDELLSRPQFGERQAQHWLDVVRYAESEGYEYDRHLPDAWRYRDYVARAFNRDKPFDQFVAEQIAGDEIGPNDHEALTASIFHRLGPVRRNAGNPDIALSRNEVLTERTDIIGAAFLGLSVGCARCHNHKLEPISQRDYYRLQAYFAATQEHNISLASTADQQAWEAETKRVKAEMDKVKVVLRTKTGEERAKLQAQFDAIEETLPPLLATIPATANDLSQRTPIHVLRRGVWEQKLAAVGPRPPSILVPSESAELPADTSQPRTQLARWLTDPQNPLLARVYINRLWQSHFGVGLVKTANDFGTRGERPSHPELLDWLSASLIEKGFEAKGIQRAIVTSSTYRQTSHVLNRKTQETLDPENRLLWKFNRRRLSAEELRDAMLATAGRLNLQVGGSSVMLPVDEQLVNQLYKPSQWQVARPAQHDRRSLYLITKRNLRLPFLETFDGPALLASCARRESSTHAPQALELLNGSTSNELAKSFATRLSSFAPRKNASSPSETVKAAFQLALGREPTAKELQTSLEFLAEGTLEEFALALFNLNDFAYVP